MKASVDRDLCEGYGTCATIAPAVFTLDEWGYASADEVPDGDETLARQAMHQCPMHAIDLEE